MFLSVFGVATSGLSVLGAPGPSEARLADANRLGAAWTGGSTGLGHAPGPSLAGPQRWTPKLWSLCQTTVTDTWQELPRELGLVS